MIEKRVVNEIAVIKLGHMSKINALNAEKILTILDQNIQQHQGIILDLSEVVYFDSTGFNTLLKIYEKANKSGRLFYLACITDEVMGLFKITKLDAVFKIFPNVDDALKKI